MAIPRILGRRAMPAGYARLLLRSRYVSQCGSLCSHMPLTVAISAVISAPADS